MYVFLEPVICVVPTLALIILTYYRAMLCFCFIITLLLFYTDYILFFIIYLNQIIQIML